MSCGEGGHSGILLARRLAAVGVRWRRDGGVVAPDAVRAGRGGQLVSEFPAGPDYSSPVSFRCGKRVRRTADWVGAPLTRKDDIMERAAGLERQPSAQDRSAGELVKQLSEQAAGVLAAGSAAIWWWQKT